MQFEMVSNHRTYLILNCSFRNEEGAESSRTFFFNVFVHDNELIEMLKGLQKRDKVLIRGFLNSKPENDQNGNKKHSAYIEATNILKVDRFSESISENINDESII